MRNVALVLVGWIVVGIPGPALAQPKAISVATLPPAVVQTGPRSGDLTVDPAATEIRVTFSKEMMDHSWAWVRLTAESFPEFAGQPHYQADKRTCVVPVKLKPGHTYAIYLNKDKFEGFKDISGLPAVSYLLVFETRR